MIKISKKYFVSTINSLQQANDLQDDINKLITKANNRNIDTTYGVGYLISHESTVVKLLELLMNDVDYWCNWQTKRDTLWPIEFPTFEIKTVL